MQQGLEFEAQLITALRAMGFGIITSEKLDMVDKIDASVVSDGAWRLPFAEHMQFTLQRQNIAKVRDFFRLHPSDQAAMNRGIHVYVSFDIRGLSVQAAADVLATVIRKLQTECKDTAFWLYVHGPGLYDLFNWEKTRQRLALMEITFPLKADEKIGVVDQIMNEGVLIRESESEEPEEPEEQTVYLAKDRFLGPRLAEQLQQIRCDAALPTELQNLVVRFKPAVGGDGRHYAKAELIPEQSGVVVGHDGENVTIRTGDGQEWKATISTASENLQRLLRDNRWTTARPLNVLFIGLFSKRAIKRVYRVILNTAA